MRIHKNNTDYGLFGQGQKIDQIKLNQLTTKQQTARTGVYITMYYKIYSICIYTWSRKNRVKMLLKKIDTL